MRAHPNHDNPTTGFHLLYGCPFHKSTPGRFSLTRFNALSLALAVFVAVVLYV